MVYMQTDKLEDGCVFCNELARPDGRESLVVFRGQKAFAILNRYPYTSGHMMVVPFEHLATLEALDPKTRAEIMELTNQAIKVLQMVYRPQGFNVGLNQGAAAGAGITDHIHIHVVPRWMGDTNFMSSLGNTRVLPESLDDTYLRVSQAWDKLVVGQ
jgi:ATP adenylyltransferase